MGGGGEGVICHQACSRTRENHVVDLGGIGVDYAGWRTGHAVASFLASASRAGASVLLFGEHPLSPTESRAMAGCAYWRVENGPCELGRHPAAAESLVLRSAR